jgi:AbiJ N-terminal domain 4
MPFELYSQRKAKLAGKYPPKQTKTSFSPRLRTALSLTFIDCIGRYDSSHNYVRGPYRGNAIWAYFNQTLLEKSDEYYDLRHERGANAFERIYSFFHGSSDEGLIDILDLGVQIIDAAVPNLHQQTDGYELNQAGVSLSAAGALAKIDGLLRENGTIYRVVDGKVVISTDDFTHEEAVVPALQALSLAGFANARAEFHAALAHYRKGEFADVLTKANHAFESTMKIISSKMRWSFNENDTAAKLVSLMITNGLCPPMRQSALTGLRTLLESDVPTLRNKTPSAGHGAGTKTPSASGPIATYAIVASAANIRLLIELYQLKVGR